MLDFFYKPQVALTIFIIFILGYLIFIDKYGGFANGFLHFGPGTNEINTTKFLGIKLDSWEKVGLLYFLAFIASLITSYYNTVINDNLHSYIWNRAIPHIPYNKFWTYLIVLVEPFLYEALSLIQFFTNLTLQLQFIIPQFLGSFIVKVPFFLKILNTKTYN